MISRVLIALVRGYQKVISPLLGHNCRFTPTCSQYMIQAIQVHGPAKGLQQQARESGVKTVFSSHNFAETPPTETMVNTLTDMVRRGADIAKLAVMPHTPADTARLLEATAQAAQATGNDTPLITMSMGQQGMVSRICGAAFGSCAGFATAGVSSAPGQPAAPALRTALDALGAMLG